MSSLALMRWLESTPERYDAGMRVVTLGRVSRVHEAVAEAAVSGPGERVLEVGCGTGAVTERLLARGAHVSALDQSPEMLEQAEGRVRGEPATRVEWIARTAAEIDALPERAFDAVVLSLCLSEMSRSERRYVLSEARRRVRDGGRIVVADEVRAPTPLRRGVQFLARGPQWLLAWLLAGSISRPVPDLAAELREAGLQVRSEQRWLLGTLALFVGEPAS